MRRSERNEVGHSAIIDRLSEKTGYVKSDLRVFMQALPEVVEEALDEGKTVRLPRLCTFRVVDVPEKEGRNPRNGETVTIPEHKSVRVKIMSSLRRRYV